MNPILMKIEPAPPGDEGLRVTVIDQHGGSAVWKAFNVEVAIDTTPPALAPRTATTPA